MTSMFCTRLSLPIASVYVFKLASDDQADLQLLVGVKWQKLCYVKHWTGKNQWNKYKEQISEPVHLEAGKLYDLKLRHVEGGGGDHVEVGVVTPDGHDFSPMPVDGFLFLPSDVHKKEAGGDTENAFPAFFGNVSGTFKKDSSEGVVVIPDLPGNGGAKGSLEVGFTCSNNETEKVAFVAELISPSRSADSFTVEVDGDAQRAVWLTGRGKDWHWSLPSPQFDVESGEHVIKIKGREDGMKIKKLSFKSGDACNWHKIDLAKAAKGQGPGAA
jgi:hypothetical protein